MPLDKLILQLPGESEGKSAAHFHVRPIDRDPRIGSQIAKATDELRPVTIFEDKIAPGLSARQICVLVPP
jgi:hypothetical protein